MKESKVVISFGSNVGDRLGYIQRAVDASKKWGRIEQVSSLYETDALYVESQAPFINGVFSALTCLMPGELLSALKEIEHDLGRIQRARNGPREIDLDIVWYEGVVSGPGPIPELPHPRAHERRFVLEPLAEIDPSLTLGSQGVVRELLHDPGVQSQVIRRIEDAQILL